MLQRPSRRKFMQTTAVIGAGYWIGGSANPLRAQSPNQRVNFASIGVDGKGQSDSGDAGRLGQMVAICDIDDRKLEKAKVTRFKEAKTFFDFRTMLEEMGDKIDAVTVSTPDHTHAVAAAMALRMGKHCFVQKPLTHTIYEARVLSELAAEKKVATQMGNQGTAGSRLRKGAAIMKSGALGTIKEVHVWTNRPVWPQGLERPAGTPVPGYLHWNEWLGPAPERPYNEAYHPFKWRGFWDFGTGALGDMACHTVNMPFMGLNLRDPVSVEAKTSGHNQETYPAWSHITFEFPELGGRPALKMYWYDGGQKVDPKLLDGEKLSDSGSLVIGEKGKIMSTDDYGGEWKLLGMKEPDVDYVESPGHFEEFVRAIQGGEPAMSNFPNYAGPLTETILLGNLAVWSGKKVEWDAKNMKATNAPELDKIVKSEYREGYSL